ncbi:MAG: VanZ family protein [Nannocystaceae bacterium]|nr:VanZ family protein [Nannocystaceae bacterium]
MSLDTSFFRFRPPLGAYPTLDALMVLATTAGLVLIVVGTPYWLRRREPALARAAVQALLLAGVASVALQLLIQRPRPALAEPLLLLPPLPSFPSGHAALVAAAVVVLVACKAKYGLYLLPLAVLVAVSRVYVGHHHLTDIAGGCALGCGIALGAVVRARAAANDPWRLRWILWPQLGLVTTISIAAYSDALAGMGWLRYPGVDKALHALLFGLLALGVHFVVRGRTVQIAGRPLQLAVAVPMVAACGDELAQAASPHRTADPMDLLADLLGLLVFAWVARRITTRP